MIPRIGTVRHKEKCEIQLNIKRKMGEKERKDVTHDFNPRPAMVKEQFWQERTST